MATLSTSETSVANVRAYLLAAYEVDEETVEAALKTEFATKQIGTAISFRSYAYYPGDKIATENGWAEDDSFVEDDDEFEDEDD